MKSNRFKVSKAYAGLKSKANALRGKKGAGRAKAKTYKGKSMKPGGGGKFQKGMDDMTAKGMSKKMASAIMAKQGMKKYGKKQMVAWSAAGRKRAKGR